ncbi:MAG: hypothetical protein ACI4TK_15480 [Agathobacter sp.]
MNKKKKVKKVLKIILIPILVVLCICLGYYLLQRYWAHRDGYFVPQYERVELTEDSDYETIFLQTGLGRSAVDKLIKQKGFQGILDAQEAFFNPPAAECRELIGWITREDLYTDNYSGGVKRQLVDIQPGDILISLSTHTGGWRHGHAAIVLDQYTIIESAVLGADSQIVSVADWVDYSNYAVLRIKDVTPEQQQEVVDYCREHLAGIPYSLLSGIFGDKAPDPDSEFFGLQCSYLAWYAWYQFGYDLDSDGGRIVTPFDLLHSDQVDIVQIYGMDPYQFVE